MHKVGLVLQIHTVTITILPWLRVLEETAGEAEGGLSPDNVHLKLGLGPHLCELLLLTVTLVNVWGLRINCVVDIERNIDSEKFYEI